MRWLLILSLTLSLSGFNAQAYDEDTHFYATYAMARYAGIKHEVAAKIAMGAQWMDESFISDPMSLVLPFAVSGVRKRRLLHFPSDRDNGRLNAMNQVKTVSIVESEVAQKVLQKLKDWTKFDGDLNALNFMTETEPDHPFATEMLMEGLKEGNLMKASVSLHVLEDSYAHAGTPAEEGHRAFWHWPDRPFADIPKYFEMTHSVLQALVAIRFMLPESALDCRLKTTTSGKANCATDPEKLFEAWSMNPEVIRAVSTDVLKHPDYVRGVVRELFTRAADPKIGYLTMTPEQIEKYATDLKLDGSKNAYTTLEGIITEMTESYMTKGESALNIYAIIADMTSLETKNGREVLDYIRSYGIEDGLLANTQSKAFKKFVAVMSRRILRWHVPRELDGYHRIEFEDDTAKVRQIEMEIRVGNMQSLIMSLYGVNIQMIPNNSKDEKGFANEIWLTDLAKSAKIQNPKPGVEYVTYDLNEKNRFDHMIFKYLYPGLKEEDLKTMVNAGAKYKKLMQDCKEYWTQRFAIWNSNSYLVTKTALSAKLDAKYGHVFFDAFSGYKIAKDLYPVAGQWFRDIVSEHLWPKADNYLYHSVLFLKDYKEKGTIKKFLGPNDLWNENMNVNRVAVSKGNIPMSPLLKQEN